MDYYFNINGDDCYGRTMKDGVARYYRVDLGNNGTQIGLLLPPDQATSEDVSDLTSGDLTQNVSIDTYISKGFVFLPLAGFYSDWLDWIITGEYGGGYYWYITEDESDDECAYYLRFRANSLGDTSDEKSYYLSVRLVHELK